MVTDSLNQEATQAGTILGELTSWKEVAQYLGVHVRTAQKWEHAYGLPLHRRPGPRGRISANTAELDAWKRQGVAVKTADRTYQWPLSPQLIVELRFQGAVLERRHVELLVAYLKLLKTALP